MSLLKQLFLAICLFLVVAFSGSFVSSVENSREQLRGQLRSHAQDAATALGLSLTPHVDDPAMVQLMVSSIFDSGYFASIRVIDIKSGKPLVERVQAHAERTVPGWFERLVDLQPQGGDALIMRGWEQAARVEVVSHPQFALARLWDSALGSLYWLLACGAASLLLGGWLLRRQLRPLDQMVRQAHAISRREFLSLPRLPRTPELRRVVQAMNQMVEKLRTLFAEEAARSDKLRAQAYQDSLTGLPNRRLFDARLNEQLGAGEHEHAGQLLLLRLNDLNGLNQRLGGQRTDELIQAVARLLVDSCGQQGAPTGCWPAAAAASSPCWLPVAPASRPNAWPRNSAKAWRTLPAPVPAISRRSPISVSARSPKATRPRISWPVPTRPWPRPKASPPSPGRARTAPRSRRSTIARTGTTGSTRP